MMACENDSSKKKIDNNNIKKNPPKSNGVNSIKYAEKSNDEKGSKYDLELINNIERVMNTKPKSGGIDEKRKDLMTIGIQNKY
ncbi:23033_t:CDS:2 [Dentiscutata erythropus]|uniref:23033_t:CDS:1 n=1 Tax=Dentiscutata erythropus TaxID=1348616 RepID=A0A9N9AX81_9GLOM|nr:23033_t:CDS:2 [Dentiscutata erythropus]